MKKLISYVLAVVMVLSLVPTAFAAEYTSAADTFTDVPADAWYLDELEYAVFNGYISGTSANTFSPDAQITRAQFVTILGRTVGVTDTTSLFIAAGFTVNAKETFSDVKAGSYYFDAVEWAVRVGIMNGGGDGKFTPEAPITVEQMGVALANSIKMAESNGIELKNFKSSAAYADASSISAWASDAMALMQKYDLLVVDANGNVNPQKVVTRAECTVSLVRFAKAVGVGMVPVFIQKSDTAEMAAKKIHDALWAEGWLNSNMTQKEKAWVYYLWLDGNCQYDRSLSKSNIHNAYGALINGLAVCDGYTAGYNMLLAAEGITCSSACTVGHEWTVATLDGVVYHIDATNGYFCWTPEFMWEYQNAVQYALDTGDFGPLMSLEELLN